MRYSAHGHHDASRSGSACIRTLKALILAQHEQLLSRESEIEHLKLLIAELQRMQFGRKSEKLDQQIEQLELRLEELQSHPADNANQAETQLRPRHLLSD